MKFLIMSFVLMGTFSCNLALEPVDQWMDLSSYSQHKLSEGDDSIDWRIREDLEYLNATCRPKDTCGEPRTTDSLVGYHCQCSAVCVQRGTCCLDSVYTNYHVKPPKIRQSCRSLMGFFKAYFMVDRCPPSDTNDSIWENQCHEDWNGEDDLMKLVPVTSLYSLITYKNYFCFRCHERTDDFLYWTANLEGFDEIDETIDQSTVTVNFDGSSGTWVAPLGIGGTLVPVNLRIDIPPEAAPLAAFCDPDVISHCPESWQDKDVRDKCEFYMGTIHIQKNYTSLTYKNAHCALCNFEDLSHMTCDKSVFAVFAQKTPFSFTHLLDVNRSDGDKVGKIVKCQGNFLWDPFAKKCRKLTCALPGYIIVNGKCTLP